MAIPGLATKEVESKMTTPGIATRDQTPVKSTPGAPEGKVSGSTPGVKTVSSSAEYQEKISGLVEKARAGTLTPEEKQILASVKVEGGSQTVLEAVGLDLANEAEFKSTHTKVGPVESDEWITNESFNNLSTEGRSKITELGVTGYNSYVEGILAPYSSTIDEKKSVDLVKAIRGGLTNSQLKDFGFESESIGKAERYIEVLGGLRDRGFVTGEGDSIKVDVVKALDAGVSQDDLSSVGVSQVDLIEVGRYRIARNYINSMSNISNYKDERSLPWLLNAVGDSYLPKPFLAGRDLLAAYGYGDEDLRSSKLFLEDNILVGYNNYGTTEDWVKRDYWNSLDSDKKSKLFALGTDEFVKWMAVFGGETPDVGRMVGDPGYLAEIQSKVDLLEGLTTEDLDFASTFTTPEGTYNAYGAIAAGVDPLLVSALTGISKSELPATPGEASAAISSYKTSVEEWSKGINSRLAGDQWSKSQGVTLGQVFGPNLPSLPWGQQGLGKVTIGTLGTFGDDWLAHGGSYGRQSWVEHYRNLLGPVPVAGTAISVQDRGWTSGWTIASIVGDVLVFAPPVFKGLSIFGKGRTASKLPSLVGGLSRELGFTQFGETYLPPILEAAGKVKPALRGGAEGLGLVQLRDTYVPILGGMGREVRYIPTRIGKIAGTAGTELGFVQFKDTYLPILGEFGTRMRSIPGGFTSIVGRTGTELGFGQLRDTYVPILGSMGREARYIPTRIGKIAGTAGTELGFVQFKETYAPILSEFGTNLRSAPGYLRSGIGKAGTELGFGQLRDTYVPILQNIGGKIRTVPSRVATELGLTQFRDTYIPPVKDYLQGLKTSFTWEKYPVTSAEWSEMARAPSTYSMVGAGLRGQIGIAQNPEFAQSFNNFYSRMGGIRGLGGMAGSMLPIYGTVAYWNKMSTPWKIASIVGEVGMFLPAVGWAARTGRLSAVTLKGTTGLEKAYQASRSVGIFGKTYVGGVGETVEAVAKLPKSLLWDLPTGAILRPGKTASSIGKAAKELLLVTVEPIVHPLQTSSTWRKIVTGQIQLGNILPEGAIGVRGAFGTTIPLRQPSGAVTALQFNPSTGNYETWEEVSKGIESGIKPGRPSEVATGLTEKQIASREYQSALAEGKVPTNREWVKSRSKNPEDLNRALAGQIMSEGGYGESLESGIRSLDQPISESQWLRDTYPFGMGKPELPGYPVHTFTPDVERAVPDVMALIQTGDIKFTEFPFEGAKLGSYSLSDMTLEEKARYLISQANETMVSKSLAETIDTHGRKLLDTMFKYSNTPLDQTLAAQAEARKFTEPRWKVIREKAESKSADLYQMFVESDTNVTHLYPTGHKFGGVPVTRKEFAGIVASMDPNMVEVVKTKGGSWRITSYQDPATLYNVYDPSTLGKYSEATFPIYVRDSSLMADVYDAQRMAYTAYGETSKMGKTKIFTKAPSSFGSITNERSVRDLTKLLQSLETPEGIGEGVSVIKGYEWTPDLARAGKAGPAPVDSLKMLKSEIDSLDLTSRESLFKEYPELRKIYETPLKPGKVSRELSLSARGKTRTEQARYLDKKIREVVKEQGYGEALDRFGMLTTTTVYPYAIEMALAEEQVGYTGREFIDLIGRARETYRGTGGPALDAFDRYYGTIKSRYGEGISSLDMPYFGGKPLPSGKTTGPTGYLQVQPQPGHVQVMAPYEMPMFQPVITPRPMPAPIAVQGLGVNPLALGGLGTRPFAIPEIFTGTTGLPEMETHKGRAPVPAPTTTPNVIDVTIPSPFGKGSTTPAPTPAPVPSPTPEPSVEDTPVPVPNPEPYLSQVPVPFPDQSLIRVPSPSITPTPIPPVVLFPWLSGGGEEKKKGITYTLSAEVFPRDKGNVDPEYETYGEGEYALVRVMPVEGTRFVKWRGDVEPGKIKMNPVNLVMDRDRHIVAMMAGTPKETSREMPELYLHIPNLPTAPIEEPMRPRPMKVSKKKRIQKKWSTK